MSEPLFGTVINLNAFGATIRLENGELVTAPLNDVETHRATYERSLNTHRSIAFERRAAGRRPMVTLVPQIDDPALDEQITAYLKSTQTWDADDDGVPGHERHFLRKKRRAALFEAKHDETP